MSTIFRVEKNANYVVMSNHHLRNKEMSLKSKGLLSLILSLPPTWNYSLSGLCAICKESQTALRSALKELETHKYLIRKRQKNELGQFEYEYIVYEVPYTENQYTDNQHAINVYTENNRQISNKELNIKKKNIKEKNIDKYNINNYLDILNTIPDNQLRNLYCDFLDNRNRMGDPLTIKGFELLIERVREIAGIDVEQQKSLLKKAIINNWKNVYPRGEEFNNNEEHDKLKNFYLGDE